MHRSWVRNSHNHARSPTETSSISYTFDLLSRLTGATHSGSYTGMFAHTYDAVGNQLSQTRYALDLNAGLTQVLGDGTSRYLYGVGRIAQQQSTMQYFGADGLGSVRQIYNSSGQIIANKRYDPYGNVLAQNGVGTSNYGYTGEWSQMFAALAETL